MRTIVADYVGLLLEKKSKRNSVGEFTKLFETVVGLHFLEGDKRAVCDKV